MWMNISPELLQRVKAALRFAAAKSAHDAHTKTMNEFVATLADYGERRTVEEEKYFKAAMRHHIKGELEFDQDALVSAPEGSDNIFVMSWFGVSKDMLEEPAEQKNSVPAVDASVRAGG